MARHDPQDEAPSIATLVSWTLAHELPNSPTPAEAFVSALHLGMILGLDYTELTRKFEATYPEAVRTRGRQVAEATVDVIMQVQAETRERQSGSEGGTGA